MDYTVAVDSGGQAAQGLMGAAGVSGIPHAFVVDAKGVIRHHGHPMEPRFEQVVKQVGRVWVVLWLRHGRMDELYMRWGQWDVPWWQCWHCDVTH